MNSIVDVLSREMAIHTATRVDLTGGIHHATGDHFSEKHKILKLRLAPLRGVQIDLERKLGSGAFEDHGPLNNNGHTQSAFAVTGTNASMESPLIDEDDPTRRLPREFYIRSNNSWKDRFKNGLKNSGRPQSDGSTNVPGSSSGKGKETSLVGLGKVATELEEITGIIAGCREDIKALWEDEVVQKVLSKSKHRVDESSGLCVLRPNRFGAKY